MQQVIRIMSRFVFFLCVACENHFVDETQTRPQTSVENLSIDATTGIPFALTFQHPITGFDTSDYGFGFGQVNSAFCAATNAQQECTSYGYHLGRDTQVRETPVGTIVTAPADGIVRLTTDITYGGYGSDAASNSRYNGCVIVLEHLLKNRQAITTLLGHVQCESGSAYDPIARIGNPSVGTIVRRGQYVAHVAHYWHGAGQSTDWHHLHWAVRKGRFRSTEDATSYVEGYAPRTVFSVDATTGALVHPEWIDPFMFIAANSDPVATADVSVRSHPSGSLLMDGDGRYWFVTGAGVIAEVSADVLLTDRYDVNSAIQVSDEEINCAQQDVPVAALGHVTLYVRPGGNTVVMAYDQEWQRYDVARWEALLSWGYDDTDLIRQASAAFFESSYAPKGLRQLRPGTLVKADDASEVAIVTAQQTRLPIISGDVFERAGYRWERIVSLPAAVLDIVAGPRESVTLTVDDLHRCATASICPGGAVSCGGGAPPEQPPADGGTATSSDTAYSKPLYLEYRSPISGPIRIEGWWQRPDGSMRAWEVIPCEDVDVTDDRLACNLPVPPNASPFEFQVVLPGPAYWGDLSCVGGGCGMPLGDLVLSKGEQQITYEFIPNSSGPPYYNGHVVLIPW